MASSMPAPLQIIQDSRYTKQEGWRLDDISLCSSGNIALSGHDPGRYPSYPHHSYVGIYGSTSTDDNSDSRDKPTLLYHKRFADEESWPWRYISFIKPNSTEIVTCRYNEVQVIDYNRDVVLRSREVNGGTRCLSVSESQIFIGLSVSAIVNIYDNDLNEIKSIRLKGIRLDWPLDIAAAADILYVCTDRYSRAIVYSQDSGSILTEYTIGQDDRALSIAVNIQLGLTAVLWEQYDTRQKQIIFYLLSENKSFLTVNAESGVSRIRISDQGRTVTGDENTREVKVYNLASLFSYSRLKESLVSRLGRDDCEKLADFFDMGGEVLKGILNSDRPASTLLLALEEKGIIQPSNVDRLGEAFLGLEMRPSFYHAVNMYQKLRDTPTISTFEKFVAGFSTFLTSDLFEALCEHFNISASEKSEVLLDNAPGLGLLALLKAKNIITPTDVSPLAIPAFANLKQVMAKINRYQRGLRESNIPFLQHQSELTLEEKADIFIHYLHLNIKSWYESICPLPWKKASHWGLSDLFIACGLTLTNTKSHTSHKNVDTKCIVTYDDIFKHPSLQDVLRIVVEGNPGSGKTMLASQIAYDWTEGKFEKIEFAILLQLKYMEDMTIPEAITKLILPLESPLTEADVEAFLENADPCKVCLILDGLEEYTRGRGKDSGPQKSEVMKVMHGEKLPDTKVIITTRSEYLQDLPKCPMLKIRHFGKQERDKYVEKIFPQDIEKQNDVIMAVENNPLLLELCDVPLLFVMAVHNIDRIAKASDDEKEKVTPFIRNIIQTLCNMGHVRAQPQDQLEKSKSPDSNECKTIESDDSEIFLLLEEVAFNGLCTGKQQLMWPMTFVQNKISDFGTWVDSGILVIEEEIKRTKRNVTQETTMKVHMADDPSASDKSRGDLLTEMDIETKAMRPKINDVVPVSVSDVETPSGDNQHTLETNIDRDISKNVITVLQARFLHKIIQEWFAAKHLCNILQKYNKDEVEQCLNLISPIELHYILRFACGISSKASPLILTYLTRYHHGLENDKQGPVADCICQCFLEHSGDREELKEVVTDFCKTGITICEEDSRQLQKAKISLLNFASENKILVLNVKLIDVWQSLSRKGNTIGLSLNSEVYLPPLHEVQSLTITSWDLKLQDLDCDLLMKYLYEWPSLQQVDLRFPVPPRKLKEDLINKPSLTDKKVTWSIGTVTHYLNEKGEWPLIYLAAQSSSSSPSAHQQQRMQGSAKDVEEMQESITNSFPGTSTQFSKYSHTQRTPKQIASFPISEGAAPEKKIFVEDPAVKDVTEGALQAGTVSGSECKDDLKEIPFRNIERKNFQEETVASSYTARKTIITKVGGTLEIPNTGILLVIPPNALPADQEEHEILMRYIPRRTVEDEVKCFSSNSTAVVEILPNISLQHPVRLSLPHCLVLQQNLERTAKIFASRHEKGAPVCWEERKQVPYHVEDTTCIIMLTSFSWYKYCIADETVIAKKIVVYTAAQKPKPHDGVVRIEVGCYPDLPGQEEDIPGGNNLVVAHKKILYFVKSEKQHPLQISLNGIFPSEWQCRRSSKSTDIFSKKIPYSKISEDLGNTCVYILEKPSNVATLPLCVFTASQEKDIEMDNIAVQLAVNFQVIDKVPSTAGVTEGHKCESSLKTEQFITNSGEELEIPGTGVVLKIPPNALEGNGENQFVGMRIIPTRIIEDQGTYLSSNSCTAVEVYPHTVRLRHPVELRLPHCLTFNENSALSARILTNYKKGNLAKWEIDTQPEYRLDEKACVIKLNEFCGVKYFIDDDIVQGKKIRVYTASKKLEQVDEVAELEVGFYADIPGGGELLRMNPTLAVDSYQKCLYMRKEKFPLQLSLDDIAPSLWECWFPKDKPQDIPVEAIAASIEHSNLFILKKTSGGVGIAVCTFTTIPKEGPMSLEMALSVCPQDESNILQCKTKVESRTPAEKLRHCFMFLKKNVAGDWRDLGRCLKFITEDDIIRLGTVHKDEIQEGIYQMLLTWQQRNGSLATTEILIGALNDIYRKDLAEKLAAL